MDVYIFNADETTSQFVCGYHNITKKILCIWNPILLKSFYFGNSVTGRYSHQRYFSISLRGWGGPVKDGLFVRGAFLWARNIQLTKQAWYLLAKDADWNDYHLRWSCISSEDIPHIPALMLPR